MKGVQRGLPLYIAWEAYLEEVLHKIQPCTYTLTQAFYTDHIQREMNSPPTKVRVSSEGANDK